MLTALNIDWISIRFTLFYSITPLNCSVWVDSASPVHKAAFLAVCPSSVDLDSGASTTQFPHINLTCENPASMHMGLDDPGSRTQWKAGRSSCTLELDSDSSETFVKVLHESCMSPAWVLLCISSSLCAPPQLLGHGLHLDKMTNDQWLQWLQWPKHSRQNLTKHAAALRSATEPFVDRLFSGC